MKKLTERLTAVILTLAICFSLAAPAANAVNIPKNFDDYREMINSYSFNAMSTKTFFDILDAADKVIRFLTFRGFSERDYFDLKTDKIINDLCNEVSEKTPLDLLMVVDHFPESRGFAEFVVGTFKVDTAALRNRLYELRFQEDAKGNKPMAILYYFLGAYFSIIDECEAYCVPHCDEKGCYEVWLKLRLRDGTIEKTGTGVLVNTETGLASGVDGNGILGSGYMFSLEDLVLYTQINVWMRDFGFCFFYDLFSYTTPFFFYETRRIKFNYDGLEWMVQVWKGNYLISNGAEIGIYTREKGSLGTYYDCATDEQMMNMSMKLYHGDDLLFERPLQRHWWLTGFQLSNVLYPSFTQTVDFTIELKDEEMRDAFCKAVEKHYMRDMEYTVDGLTVNVIW